MYKVVHAASSNWVCGINVNVYNFYLFIDI